MLSLAAADLAPYSATPGAGRLLAKAIWVGAAADIAENVMLLRLLDDPESVSAALLRAAAVLKFGIFVAACGWVGGAAWKAKRRLWSLLAIASAGLVGIFLFPALLARLNRLVLFTGLGYVCRLMRKTLLSAFQLHAETTVSGSWIAGINSDMTPTHASSSASKWVFPAVGVVLAVLIAFAWATVVRERSRTESLAADNRALKTSLDHVQTQLDLVSRRMSALNEAVNEKPQITQAASEPAPRPAQLRRISPATKPVVARPDPRVERLQVQLAGQEKELASTRDQLASTRRELEEKLGTTQDELSGSIARTHEELQDLKRRGERNYYEFDLFKNKQFSRVGPLGLSLRKADTKRKSFQVKLRLDDQEFEKKNVNLFEPILISAPDSSQPLQLVVNEISKDRIRGYVSELKMKQPAVARSNSQPLTLQTRQ